MVALIAQGDRTAKHGDFGASPEATWPALAALAAVAI